MTNMLSSQADYVLLPVPAGANVGDPVSTHISTHIQKPFMPGLDLPYSLCLASTCLILYAWPRLALFFMPHV